MSYLGHRSLVSYCIYKHNFSFEKYLESITENKYKAALARFRTSSHDLLIENGRYDDTPRNQRLCKSCNMHKVEDEYHFYSSVQIIEIQGRNTLRAIFVILMSTTSKKAILSQVRILRYENSYFIVSCALSWTENYVRIYTRSKKILYMLFLVLP